MTSKKEWDAHCAQVTEMMTNHVKKFVTPLSVSKAYGDGAARGTGTYIKGKSINGTSITWILTAAHVVEKLPQSVRIAHLPDSDGQYCVGLGEPEIAAWPIDAAALPVYPDDTVSPAPERIVNMSSVASKYQAIDNELLFWIGFPGFSLDRNDRPTEKQKEAAHRIARFGELYTPGAPMLTQAIANDSISATNFDPDKHLGVHYPHTATRAKDGKSVVLPMADGMSGSALWDTKFLACALDGVEWSPEMAEICGVVWAVTNNPEAIIATKIEYARLALPNVF